MSILFFAICATIFCLLLTETVSAKREIFDIDLDQVEQHYVDLLFNDELNFSQREHLSRRIGAVLFHMSISTKVSKLMDEFRKMPIKGRRSVQKKINFDKSYEYIRRKIELECAENSMTLENLCYLWRFESLLLQYLDSDKTYIEHKCEEADKFDLQNDVKLPKWMLKFRSNMSRKHYEFLLEVLSEDRMRREIQFWQWFDREQRMPEESILSFRLRSCNVMERLDELSGIKQIMSHHLFFSELNTFDLMVPIHMAIDVGNEVVTKKIFKELFASSQQFDTHSLIRWLEFLIVPSTEDILDNVYECTDVEKVNKLVHKIRNTSIWMSAIHYFCLHRLIRRFKMAKDLFCYGNNSMCIHPTCKDNVTEHLIWMVGTNVVDKLQMAMPEIMHYELLNEDIYRSCFIEQLSHKTDSIIAQIYEARIITPYLLQTTNQIEQKFKEGKCSLAEQNMCPIFLRTIEHGKSQIYKLFKFGYSSSNNLRVALCQIIGLNQFLAENEQKLMARNEAGSVEILPNGDLSSACNSEDDIIAAFWSARKKLQHSTPSLFELVETNLTSHGQFRSLIRDQPGAYARLKNYLVEILTVSRDVVADLATILNLHNPAVFYNDELLFTNFIGAHFSNDPTVSLISAMRTTITVFVRWMDSKIADAINQNGITILSKRPSKAWLNEARRFFENLYGQTYDFDEGSQLTMKNVETAAACEVSRQYVEKVLKSKKLKPEAVLANDWRKMIEKAFDFDVEMKFSEDNEQFDMQFKVGNTILQHQFIEWMLELQQEQFKKLITSNNQFRTKLKKEAENSPDCADDLYNFFGGDAKAFEILNLWGLGEQLVNAAVAKENDGDKDATKKQKVKKKKKPDSNTNKMHILPKGNNLLNIQTTTDPKANKHYGQ